MVSNGSVVTSATSAGEGKRLHVDEEKKEKKSLRREECGDGRGTQEKESGAEAYKAYAQQAQREGRDHHAGHTKEADEAARRELVGLGPKHSFPTFAKILLAEHGSYLAK